MMRNCTCGAMRSDGTRLKQNGVDWHRFDGGPCGMQQHIDIHKHCDSDPIECGVQAMEGDYAERGRQIDILTKQLFSLSKVAEAAQRLRANAGGLAVSNSAAKQLVPLLYWRQLCDALDQLIPQVHADDNA